VKTWTTLYVFLRFFDLPLPKTLKLAFFRFWKKRKQRILELCR